MALEMVPTDREDACPLCGGELAGAAVGQGALFKHGGYGETKVTESVWCSSCGEQYPKGFTSERPW